MLRTAVVTFFSVQAPLHESRYLGGEYGGRYCDGRSEGDQRGKERGADARQLSI